MKKFLDEHGLQTYDQKIKEYIENNAFNPSNMQTVSETVTINQASIPTAVSISNGETGFTTGDQVYNHVLNALSGITGVMTFKGVFSASGPSGFPSRNTAKAGDLYVASISNANGYITVDSQKIENGDSVVFTSDGSENVNANFTVIQGNLSNVLTCPNNSPSIGKFVEFSGTGTQTRPSNYTVSSLTEKIIDETIDTLTYGKLRGIPFETGCKTEYYLGTFTQTVDFDPTTGNWIDPEDPTNVLTPDEVWGYNSQTGEYSQGDLTWRAIKQTYPQESVHGGLYWQNYGIEYYPCTWAGPYGYEFYLDMSATASRNLCGLLSNPTEILDYSVRLTYNGVQYVLPIEEHYTRGDDGNEPELNGYYVGQRDVENVNPPVRTQAEDRALWTHPFKVFFELNGNPVSGYISAIKVSLRVSENGILGGVEVVKTEDVGVPTQIPVQCVPIAESISSGEKRFTTGDQVYDYIQERVPDAPTTDGTYVLKVTVASGVPTYSWVNMPSQ